MTRDEALRKVKGYLTDCLPKDDYDEVEEIVNALKQESSNDCVSRQAILKEIPRLWNSNGDKDYCMESLRDFVTDLPSVTSTQRWISTGKRLPTREEYIASNGLFIVSDGNRVYTAHFDVYESMSFGKPTTNGFKVDKCVTAWMPLPILYEMPLSKLYLPKLHKEDQKDEDNREVKD